MEINTLTGWKCPNCGRVISPYSIFCPFCSDNSPKISTDAERDNTVNRIIPKDVLDEYLNGPKEGGVTIDEEN